MHLTVRMAWHDSNWNGKVCCDPAANTYCTGAHSLLSGRIEKKKRTDVESAEGVRGEFVAKNFNPQNVPPCYWSINAFSEQEFSVEHRHAFDTITETIPEVVRKHSVITWPFKLSFVHSEENQKRWGNYPPDLNQRIDHYISKFKPDESLLFFYANYDNPVSADEMRYLVVGCSVVSELPTPTHFPIAEEKLKELRAPKSKKKKVGKKWVETGEVNIKMSNLPTMNWMLQFSHDPQTAVILPYKEYVAYVEAHPGTEDLLNDVKVTIEETSLIRGFKYVSMDIDDDKCLYLLYKMRKAIKKAQEHKQQVVKRDLLDEEQRIEALIRKVWTKRGIYPSLIHVLNHFIDNQRLAGDLATAMQPLLSQKRDLSQFFKSIIAEEIPDELATFEDELLDLAENRVFKKYGESLAQLALYQLTSFQVDKIIGNKALLEQIARNPYALYEEYETDADNLDEPDMQDEPIDVFKVDMGAIPDKRYATRHRQLQRFREDSPERVRSVILNHLQSIGEQGHCYDSARELLKVLHEHPLIYKMDIELDDEALLNLDEDYRSHFIEKLYIDDAQSDDKYFYLHDTKKAEVLIRRIIDDLVERKPHMKKFARTEDYIKGSLSKLANIIKTSEDKALFTEERQQLYNNIFARSYFLLTGKPGAGKTVETSRIIEELYNAGEEVVVLAPTGKAALRLTDNIRQFTALKDIQAKTIDKYIFEHKFGWTYDSWSGALALKEDAQLKVENLVIDECSMLDLKKLSILLSIIQTTGGYPKRIIMVGDENQLPPIGFGKPFHDIIQYVQADDTKVKQHYIHLKSNCRQENDANILKLAEAFTDKTRGYEEAFNILEGTPGKKSDGLYLYKWSNKAELDMQILGAINEVFRLELGTRYNECENDFQRLNALFGLYDNGHVNNSDYDFPKHLKLEELQLLTPYRAGYYGTLGLNRLMQAGYRPISKGEGQTDKYFRHAEKILRLSNWYWGKGENRKLVLSNGSIGIVTQGKDRRFYFKESDKPFNSVDEEENFDLAYSITVHKSQGSDFRNVFLIIPQKLALLSKELLYTALTRSKYRLFIFLQDSERDLLQIAKNNSHLINRNTSVFEEPISRKGRYLPEPDVAVASKVEMIIYETLRRSGIAFKYEQPLQLDSLKYKIHPDFTIKLRDGRELYWEHLGMLDTRKYYKDWQDRYKAYCNSGKKAVLITTDDLLGVKQDRLDQLIENIKADELKDTSASKFSAHHYELY